MRPRPRGRPPLPRRGPLAHAGLALRRHPRLWWVAVLTATAVSGGIVASLVSDAEDARAAWGATRPVLVVQRSRAAGEVLRPGDVALVEWPEALVPSGALDVLPDDAVVRTDVGAGEVLVGARLARRGATGLAATLGASARAVAIPTEPGTAPPLAVGDRVDVLVALAGDIGGEGPPGFVVAADALVVALDEAAVTVAVDRSEAPRIAVALGLGAVTLALVGA